MTPRARVISFSKSDESTVDCYSVRIEGYLDTEGYLDIDVRRDTWDGGVQYLTEGSDTEYAFKGSEDEDAPRAANGDSGARAAARALAAVNEAIADFDARLIEQRALLNIPALEAEAVRLAVADCDR